jgi:hypothetical protein
VSRPYEYVLVDPTNLPESSGPPFRGTNGECLAAAFLDVLHVALDSGMTQEDVDEALSKTIEHVAHLNRERFRVHRTHAT